MAQKTPDSVGPDANSTKQEAVNENQSSQTAKNADVTKNAKVTGVIKAAVIIVTVMVVMVFVWAGAVLLWYVARGWIAFLGLLFSGIATLIAIVGLFGQDFLKRVEHAFAQKSEKDKILLFIGTVIGTVAILLAFLVTLMWQFDPT